MSHEYFLTIEVRGVRADEEGRVLNEIIPRWWNGEPSYDDRRETLWVAGKDRLAGAGSLEDMRIRLASRISNLLLRHVDVTFTGEDREGPNEGKKLQKLERGPVFEFDDERLEEILVVAGDRDDPRVNLTRSMALEIQRLLFEIRRANRS